ncbi:hypothetical protein QJS04_geneDACA024340 [Acorus gramineus]|uniref:Reverse transcriptase/retrotransposon-derived protein RNase H-like domain-containing protein n=1 Tax=Acorus gramineus TaxID=55184 RepID=A0AAV9A3L6_ACOGR|nr:hypothetical protein QJS04_geneDACA024340 [Acorus gramineus]
MSNWRRPSSPAWIRSFRSLAGYCRKLDEGLSKIAVPLNRLTRRDIRFEWSPSCEESFLEFTRRLTSAPILTSPSWSGGFAVGKGCVRDPAHVIPFEPLVSEPDSHSWSSRL